MVKLSLVILAVLTVLISIGLRWREERVAAVRAATPRRGGWVAAQKKKLNRWVTAASLAFANGTNDAQKTMGVNTTALVAAGTLSSFTVPLWVKV